MKALFLAALLLFPAAAHAQAVIAGVVYSPERNAPIAHARIEIPGLGRELFTGPGGRFAVRAVPPGTYRVLARFVGHSPEEVTVRVEAGADPAPLRIELRRIPVMLTEVRVQSLRDCRNPGLGERDASSQLAILLGEMSENARRFRLLASQFPFTYSMERSVVALSARGDQHATVDTARFEGDDGWRYRPGTLLMPQERRLRLPDLGHFADSAFIATHCFGYSGADTLDGQPVARIDFLPSRSIRSVDVRGWIALDPDTYQIRGTVFNITNRGAVARTLEDLEVRTYFTEVAEALPVFSRVVSRHRYDPGRIRHGDAVELREELRLVKVTFRGASPAAITPAPAAAGVQPETGELTIASDATAESLLVDVRSLDSTIVVDMRYGTANNFTGAPLPGYLANRALLRREAAAALARVQRLALAQGYRLKVYDAYRPVRATDAMMDWTRRTGREDLVRDGYIASRSRHNLGLAIDLTLVDASTLEEFPMGTPYDTFSSAAHTANASGLIAGNRQVLVRLMEKEGFANYDKEWWHFAFDAPLLLRFDMVIR